MSPRLSDLPILRQLKVGDRVRYKRSGEDGVIVRDLGVKVPVPSDAPLAEAWSAEQAWEVEFDFRPYKDLRGCWDSDLELIKEPKPEAVSL